MKKIFFLTLFTLIHLKLLSQKIKLQGGIYNEYDIPIENALVNVLGTSDESKTDAAGFFSIETNIHAIYKLKIVHPLFNNRVVTIKEPIKIDKIKIKLFSSLNMLDEVVVTASKTKERSIEAPVIVYKMSALEMKNSGGINHYDAISKMRGLQSLSSSIFLPSYNTRGFSDAANFRFKQMLDGYDTQSTIGLSVGNSLGVSDLDIVSAELIHGASSSIYGSDAFNGLLSMYSKNPFDYPGLSFQSKFGTTVQNAAGVNPYFEQDLRIAHPFNDKLAIKIDVNYRKAHDWIGTDYNHRVPNGQWDNRAYFQSLDINNPDGYLFHDALHRLGDEYSNGVGNIRSVTTLRHKDGSSLQFAPGTLTRTGISEKDLFTLSDVFNNEMKSFRGNFSLFYRPNKDWELELLYKYSFSDWLIRSSSTFPQFDYLQRFYLFRVNRNEQLKFRAYHLKLDNYKGSWSAVSAANAIQKSLRSDEDWANDFANNYYETGSLREARLFADRFMPGGAEFNIENFDAALAATTQNTSFVNSGDGIIAGSQAVDFSSYTNFDFEYNFKDELPFQLNMGLNYRNYHINSEGAFYNDGELGFGKPISLDQFSANIIAQDTYFDDNLRLSLAFRVDKQSDYKVNSSPRISAVYLFGKNKNNSIRASYQTGYRNPSVQEGYFRLQLTSVYTIVGAAKSSLENFIYQGNSGNTYTMQEILQEIAPTFEPIQPERNSSLEFGFNSLINNRLKFNLNGYYTRYKNFINRPNIFFRPGTPDFQIFAIRQNRNETIFSYGAGLGIDYLFSDHIKASMSYDWNSYGTNDFLPTDNSLDDNVEKEAFLRSLQFNAPNHRGSITIQGNDLGAKERLGFSWTTYFSDSYNYYSNLGETLVPSYSTTDVSLFYDFPNIFTNLKIGGTNIFKKEYAPIYGAPGTGSLYYLAVRYEP